MAMFFPPQSTFFFSEASSQGDRDHQEAVEQHAENGLALHVFEDPLLPVHGMTDEEIAKHHQAKGAAGIRWGPGNLGTWVEHFGRSWGLKRMMCQLQLALYDMDLVDSCFFCVRK